MRLLIFCLLTFSLLLSSKGLFSNQEALSSAFQAQNVALDPCALSNFDPQKALDYLESLHDYLQSLGGANLYATLHEKSEEELTEIMDQLSILLSPIEQNLEHKPHWCGGLGSIGLAGLYLSLEDLFEDISKLTDDEEISIRIYGFFKYMGCKESILSLFPRDDEKDFSQEFQAIP